MVRLTQAQLNDVLEGRYEVIPDAPQSVSGMIEAEEFGTELNAALLDWCRTKHREQRYTRTTLSALLSLVRQNEKNYGENAVAEIIRISLANGYKGIVWDRLEKYPRISHDYGGVDMDYLRAVYERVKGRTQNEN